MKKPRFVIGQDPILAKWILRDGDEYTDYPSFRAALEALADTAELSDEVYLCWLDETRPMAMALDLIEQYREAEKIIFSDTAKL